MSNPRGWADATAARRSRKKMPGYFWSRVDKGEPASCWNWQASRSDQGYGKTYYEGKEQRAHRVAWILTKGEIPKGLFVCHKCDNPSCCNPQHLFLGTNQDNMQDCLNKGRRPRGSDHARAVMDEITVRRLRGLSAEIGLRPAARLMGINRSTAYHAVHDTWRHL